MSSKHFKQLTNMTTTSSIIMNEYNQSFNKGPYGKLNNSFFLETTNMTELLLYMNGQLQSWIFLLGNPRWPP
jgi:hypothetical protein